MFRVRPWLPIRLHRSKQCPPAPTAAGTAIFSQDIWHSRSVSGKQHPAGVGFMCLVRPRAKPVPVMSIRGGPSIEGYLTEKPKPQFKFLCGCRSTRLTGPAPLSAHALERTETLFEPTLRPIDSGERPST